MTESIYAQMMKYADVLIGWGWGSWDEKLALLREAWVMGDVTELHSREYCDFPRKEGK